MAVSQYVGTTYQQIQQAVADYYGSGSDAWARIYTGAGGYYSADAAKVIKQVPGVSVTYSNSGKVLGYSYSQPYKVPTSGASTINSNVQTGSYGTGSFTNSIPSTVVDNGQGQAVGRSGSRATSTGATIATVADRLTLAAVGVSLGTKLGKLIDSGIYAIAPDWWDTHYPTINPETWDDMATTQAGRQFIQGLFGLQNDVTTMYIDERLLAQTYMMLYQNGAYSSQSDITSTPESFPTDVDYCIPVTVGGGIYTRLERSADIIEYAFEGPGMWFISSSRPGYVYVVYSDTYGGSMPYTTTTKHTIKSTGEVTTTSSTTYVSASNVFTFDGKTAYGGYVNSGFVGTVLYAPNLVDPFPTGQAKTSQLAWLALYNSTSVGLDGVSDDPRAQTYIDPSLITGTTLDQVLQQLKTNYPTLFDGSIYQDTPQEDGSIDRITYIPVPVPDGITTPAPITGETSQTDPSVTLDNVSDSLMEQIIQILTHPETQPQTETTTDIPTPTPPATGDGNTPLVSPITGSASSLWKIYNPSQSEIDAFGTWLWSSNFIDQIKKLFNDPMQAIIGVHKVFCTPAVGGTTTIKCGYLDSEVSSNWVSDQYTHIDCGTVNLPEYFGNVFDYDPFTRVSLFLPCIGIVPLDVAEVMRSSISVKLHCDVLTGALLAEVNVIRDQAGGILYTYSGSCIVTYPVSSGTYIGAVANVVSVAASVAGGIMGTVASEGALAPAIARATGLAISGLTHSRTNVQHSGSFSGASGVMGGKIPYLIITRPQTCMAEQYQQYDGVPANFTTQLSACSGYVKVKEVHLKVPNAYDSEISEIEQLLHRGILI